MVECVCAWVNVHAQIHVKLSSDGRYDTYISTSACTKHCLRKGIQNHCVEVNVSVPYQYACIPRSAKYNAPNEFQLYVYLFQGCSPNQTCNYFHLFLVSWFVYRKGWL